MAKQAKTNKRAIRNYTHQGKKRPNNPPVGLVTPETDRDAGKKTYAYAPTLVKIVDDRGVESLKVI